MKNENPITRRENLLTVIRDRNSVWKQMNIMSNRKKGYGDGFFDGFHHATMLILAYLGREDLTLDIFGDNNDL